MAKAMINTFKYWDHTSYVSPFGPDATTLGQTITVPAGKVHLDALQFTWRNFSTGTMVVRAGVYAWDGTRATGPSLYEKERTISY
jgi:hypothetical protein